jgi:acyl-CoA synthetase (AMP-forming)/AMP-acid ligase II
MSGREEPSVSEAPQLARGPWQLSQLSYVEISELLERAVDASPDPCPSTFDETLAGLAKLDLPPGTTVVLALSNGTRLLRYYFGLLLTGAVPVTVSPAASSARLAALAEAVGAGAVIAARPDPRRFGATTSIALPGAEAVIRPPEHRVVREAGQVLMGTSGTSGLFSACLHRVDSLLRNASRHAAAVGLRPDDTVLVSLPLFYSYAVVAQAMAALITGARLVISGPPFAPSTYRQLLASHAITSSSITPTIARQLLADPRPMPRSLRMLTVGGDRLEPAQVAGLLASLPGGELYLTYGLTEAGPRVSTLAAHAEPARRYGTVGRPLGGISVSLRGPTGGDPVDGTGELLVHTDTAMIAKIGSAAGMTRGLVAPGVVATGDLFHQDSDGYLTFAGRLSDFVLVNGEKVSLLAVRQYVLTLPGVLACQTRVGEGCFDLMVQAEDGPAAQPRIRQAIGAFLLPGERPRSITVAALDSEALHK